MNSPLLYLQLFSLRHETSADAEGTLRQVPGLGFGGVELAGDYGWSTEKWQQLLGETKLEVIATHSALEPLESEFDEKMKFYRALKIKRVVISSLNKEMHTPAGYKQAGERLNALGRKFKAEGMQVGYHNHDFEFKPLDGGKEHGMDILLKSTDPELVHFEYDSYWLEFAGVNAVEFVRENSARVFLIHAKDLRKQDRKDVPCGSGDVDFRSLVPMCKANDWPIVLEYESGDAIEGVREGATYLRSLLG